MPGVCSSLRALVYFRVPMAVPRMRSVQPCDRESQGGWGRRRRAAGCGPERYPGFCPVTCPDGVPSFLIKRRAEKRGAQVPGRAWPAPPFPPAARPFGLLARQKQDWQTGRANSPHPREVLGGVCWGAARWGPQQGRDTPAEERPGGRELGCPSPVLLGSSAGGPLVAAKNLGCVRTKGNISWVPAFAAGAAVRACQPPALGQPLVHHQWPRPGHA